jgi:transposase-like protein
MASPQMTKHSPLRSFKTSPETIRLAVMLYVRFPLSLRNVEDLLHERGIEVGLTQAATVAIYNARIRRPRLCAAPV